MTTTTTTTDGALDRPPTKEGMMTTTITLTRRQADELSERLGGGSEALTAAFESGARLDGVKLTISDQAAGESIAWFAGMMHEIATDNGERGEARIWSSILGKLESHHMLDAQRDTDYRPPRLIAACGSCSTYDRHSDDCNR